MSHQNWKPTVLTKHETKTDKELKQNALNDKSTQAFVKGPKGNLDGKKIHKILESESFEVKTIPTEVRLEISKARQDKGWTHQDLSKYSGISVQDIKQIENGKATFNKAVVQKLKNAFSQHPAKTE